MTEAQDERRHRWRAQIDISAGKSRVLPVHTDPRMDAAASRLLDTLRRPSHATPPPHRDNDPPRAVTPLSPWRTKEGHLAGGSDHVTSGLTHPEASPPSPRLAPAQMDEICDRITSTLFGRFCDVLGLPPNDPEIPPLSREQGKYAAMNPAGSFVTVNPEESHKVADIPNPAGSFAGDG